MDAHADVESHAGPERNSNDTITTTTTTTVTVTDTESASSPTSSTSPSTREATASATTPTTTPTTTVAEAADVVLKFLATATTETLVVVGVGVSGVLYLVLGSLGLVVVGVGIGVVLHASLEGLRGGREGDRIGLGQVQWNEKREEVVEERVVVKRKSNGLRDFSMLPPETQAALEELSMAVVRDYVRHWYSPLLPHDNGFPKSVNRVLKQTFLNLHNHLSQKRAADSFLSFLFSTSNTFIVFFRELSQVSRGASIATYVEEYPSSALAQLLDREIQKRKLRMAADDIVQTFAGREVADCEPVRVFLTEILAGVVLEMTVEKCSEAEWINGWIVYLLEKETQPEILQRIDLGEATQAASKAADTNGNGNGTANGNGNGNVKPPQVINGNTNGNAIGNTNGNGNTSGSDTPQRRDSILQHKKSRSDRLSRAEEEMQKAIKEAEELSRMIAEEEEKAKRASTEIPSPPSPPPQTTGILDNPQTGSDSDSDKLAVSPKSQSRESLSTTPPPQPPAEKSAENTFTSFDQLVPATLPQDLLYRAHVLLSDLSPPSATAPTSRERPLKAKPTSAMYLLQLEPQSSSVPGWILTRKYSDFETLHEVLYRIAMVSPIDDSFKRSHTELPSWRGETMETLRAALERYLNDALKERLLAECEGMKRFLEKDAPGVDTPPGRSPIGGSGPFAGLGRGWNPQPFAKMGDVLDALKAPAGAEGGKNIFGFAGKGIKRLSTAAREKQAAVNKAALEQARQARLERRVEEEEEEEREEREGRRTRAGTIQLEIPEGGGVVVLPPPPSDIADDYDKELLEAPLLKSEPSTNILQPSPIPNLPPTTTTTADTTTQPPVIHPTTTTPSPPKKPELSKDPLTETETQMTIEIIFALISELYSLSSAWLFRRSLLNVAKSFLLRSGNAQLENIRNLLQTTVIDANVTDKAVAGYVRKVRCNAFPTQAERDEWKEKARRKLEKGGEDAEELRERARRLVCERGLPEALRGVMGAGASAECLGAVFDAVQEKSVARGVVVGIVLEAVRGVCQ
ncbi:hypothetical protein RUND412_001075 [Rhizina undulata]